MRRWLWFLVLGAGFVIASQSLVYAIDPPHSRESGVDCAGCHGVSVFLDDQSGMTPTELKAAYNAMCLNCHDQTGGSYHGVNAPTVEKHDSAVTATFGGGAIEFHTDCMDCHHPHFQNQQVYWGRRLSLAGQLILGQLVPSGISYDTDPTFGPVTIAEYNPATLTPKAGSKWDTTDGLYPDGSGGEPIDVEDGLKMLETKGYNPVDSTGRGALMLPWYRSHYEGRMIVAIDTTANTITFKGTVDPNYEVYMQTYGFAIYLGMAINNSVDFDRDGDGNTDSDPTRPVYLFDRTGPYSFAHQDSCTGGTPPGQEEGVSDCTDSTITGMCQACHTLPTKYYRMDGTGKLHYNGRDCFECHSHVRGFTATTVDHTADPIFLGRTPVECSGCHDPGLSLDYVSDIHAFTCDNCHTGAPPLLRQDYGPGAGWLGPSKDCVGCHENGTELTYKTEFDNLTTAHQVQDHSGLTGVTNATPVDNCSGCHDSSPKADIVSVTHNNNCYDCHNNTSTDGRLHTGNIAASFGGTTSYGTNAGHALFAVSTCSDCHSTVAADFENHIYGTPTDHAPGGSGSTMILDTTAGTGDRSQETGALCSDCHSDYDTQQATTDDLLTWRSIIYEHDLDGTKDGIGACATCHNATRDVCANPAVCTQDGPTIQQVIAANGNPTHCQDCHEAKVDALSTNAVHGNHDTSAFGWDSNCIDCHSTANDYVVQEVHNDNCDICHSGGTYTADTNTIGSATNGVDGDATRPGAEGDAPNFTSTCTTCHPLAGDTGLNSVPLAHHVATPNDYAANDNCTQCHVDSGSYAGDHTSTVSLATNCLDCHTGAEGNSGPTFNIPTASGDNKVHDSCKTCHATDGGLTGASGVAQANPDGGTYGGTDGGGSCETCHTSGFDGYHVSSVDHSSLVSAYSNCSSCHTETGSTVAPGDPKTHDACSTCHQADGRMSGSAVGNDGGTNGGSDGGGTCFTCHTEYFDSHTNIDHSTSVALDTATGGDIDCIDCHTGAEGSSTTVPLDASTPAGDKMHDSCSQCHEANGALTGSAAGNDGGTGNGIDGGGDCTVCHGSYFDSHTHHDGGSNQASFSSTIDRSQETNDDANACYQCHDDANLGKGTSALSTWDSIRLEHDIWDGTPDATGGCTTCHDYTTVGEKTGDANTPLLATVQAVIGTDATAYCTTCHVPKLWSTGASSTHGGHADSHFTWGTSNCIDCHSTTNDFVVSEVHSGNCDLCHTGSPYGANNNGISSASATLNGKDGDAALAEGDAGTWTATCTTCHPYDGDSGAFNTVPLAHHVATPNDYAANDNCTQCHVDSGSYAGDHTSTVSLATNCLDCHTGTEGNSGPTFNIPTASGDNKVHDSCKACHATDGGLTGASGVAQANPDGGTYGGTDGGGSCETCHTNGFDGYHTSSVDHTAMVATYSNCTSCHTASGGTVNPGDPKTHDACSTCHQADGRLSGSATGQNGAGHGGSDGGGTCFTCHTEYFDSHTNIDHSTSVALDTATGGDIDCVDCHTGTEGSSTTVPLDASTPAGDKKHDSCSQCHEANGALTGSAAGNDGGTGNGTDGGGDCTVCHGSYFDSHTHHDGGSNQVSFSSTIDRSQETNNDANACYQCHDDANLGKGTSALSTWDSIRLEHDIWDGTQDATGGCTTCHDYTTVGEKTGDANTPLLGTVQTVIGTDATANCTTCHVPKLWSTGSSSSHGGHAASHFTWGTAGCEECHGAGAATEAVVGTIHGGDCTLCHTGSPEDATNNGIGTTAASTNGKDGDAALAEGDAGTWTATCRTCHPADGDAGSFNTPAEAHHVATPNNDATAGNCVACHMPDVGAQSPLANRNDIMMPTNLACNWCHLWWPNNTDYIDQATDNGYDTTTVSGKVMIYRLNWDPETNQRTYATRTSLTSHAISTNNTQPINDYGACFACHGASGVDNGFADGVGADMIRPFHGVGDPITSTVAVPYATGSNTDHTRHLNNFFSGPQQTTTSAAAKTDPYHPGVKAFNHLATELRGGVAAPGNKMYNTDDKNFKFIHQTEQSTVLSCYNQTIEVGTVSAEYNNWGADLGSVGNVTILTGALEGQQSRDTVMPLVDISLPSNIGPQTCP